jgi:hypothetical protein
MSRTLSFDINARSTSPLAWRRTAGGSDAVSPAAGTVQANGLTSVTTTAIVMDESLGFEVVDASGRVVLRFTMRHR